MATEERPNVTSHLTKSDLVPHSLANATTDALDHDAVAAVVADLVMSVDAPANIALFGPWGSGKSSLYGMVRDRVERLSKRAGNPVTKVVRYDAWKFGGPSLQRNFLTVVAEEAGLKEKQLDPIYGATETARIRLWQFLRNNKASIAVALLIAALAAAVWVVLKASMAWYVGTNGKPNGLLVEAGHALPSGMVVLGVVVTGLLLSNQTLSSAIEKRTHSPMQDADQFYNAFSELMKIVTKKKWLSEETKRLVVFIDELDRCSPQEVASTLTDLLTFLDHPRCVFVVAADREALEEAIEKAPQAKPIREDEPYYSTAGAFLDKIFQHQMSLPPMRPEALTVYARGVADNQGGLWKHLRDLHDATYDDVVYSLVPAHVRSPRRVKVLLNNYATNVRVMEARGLQWDTQAVQVAVFTVLQTEFASVLRDFIEQPRILHALTGQVSEPTPALQRLIDKYAPPAPDGDQPAADTEGPSPLLTSDEKTTSSTAAEQRAVGRLNQQLHDYLGRIAAASIDFPSLDLAYLQRAGHADGIEDTDFARALDTAADVAPAATMRVIRELPAWEDHATRVAAIRYLIAQMSTRFGPLRDNLVEVAALIAYTLDTAPASEVARFAAPRLLQEAGRGHWRNNATHGAVRLALLDTQMGDPFEFLPEETLAGLHEDGVLESIIGHLHELPPGRAHWTYRHIAAAYAVEPDYFFDALKVLPAGDARNLWTTQLDTIRPVIEALPEAEPVEPPASSTARQRAAATASVATVTPASVADERAALMQQVFEALMARPTPDDFKDAHESAELWASVIDYTTDRERAADSGPYDEILDAIYRTASAYAPVFKSVAEDDSALLSIAACNALVRSPDLASAIEWGKLIRADHCPVSTEHRSLYASGGRVLIAYLSAAVEPDTCAEATSVFGSIAELLAPFAENAGAAAVFSELKSHPPTAANKVIREQQIRLLEHIVAHTNEPEITVSDHIHDSLVHAIDEHGLPNAEDLPYYLAEVNALNITDAERFAKWLREAISETDDQPTGLARTRLLIAANKQAQQAAINPDFFLKFIDDSAASGPLVLEWMATTPTAAMVSKIAHRTALTASSLGGWADQRNITERSKLWLALERNHYREDLLAAVGSRGVNRTVVDRMAPRITAANLNDQPNETRLLLTADLSARDARVAAHDLATTLLDSGVAGSVPNAVKILIAASGGDPARRETVKKTLEAVSHDKIWTRLPVSDRQALVDLRLVPRPPKRSLLSRLRSGS